MYCDLHTHSNYSDGTWTPTEIVAQASKQNLVVALTDHNTVSGLPEFLAEADRLGVEAVPGIEFSTDYQGKEVHIVALFVQKESYDAIRAYVQKGDEMKVQSNRDLVARLNEAGYAIDYQHILAQTPDGRVNRANIAAELVRHGYVASVKEAFSKLLGADCGFYTPPKRPEALDTVAFIRTIGALPVLAHPFLSLSEAALRIFLPEAKGRGLAAMETLYATYDDATTMLARQMAAEFGLLESGGSDFHGAVKPDNPLGKPCIPKEVYEQLKYAM